MGTLEVYEVKSRKDLREFVLFPFSLYKDCPHWIPPLIREEIALFDPNRNPAFEFCKIRQWIAKRNNHTVGRIAGITHRLEVSSNKTGRFGWVDFIDDLEVSKSLFQQVENWFQESGIELIHGPFGFSDMDPEGMLVKGFDSPTTIATIYNYEYYPSHLEQLGYITSAEWIEWFASLPQFPERLSKSANVIERRFKIRSKHLEKKDLPNRGKEMFRVLNESFKNLYGFQSLSAAQIDFYVEKYLAYIDPELNPIVVNEKDEIVGFSIAIPSLSSAFKKANGRLFPLGAFHILRSLKQKEEIDLYLIGVRPDFQRKGVVALIFRDLWSAFERQGFKRVRSNAILVDNNAALKLFSDYEASIEVHKRRRCFKKSLK